MTMLDTIGLPRLVWWQRSPYKGGDEIDFVLYESGVAIWRTDPHQYQSVHLTSEEVAALWDRLPLAAFADYRSRYSISDATDMPEDIVMWWCDDGLKGVTVYGAVGRFTPDTAPRLEPIAGGIVIDLGPFVAVLHALRDFSHPNARPWHPDKLRVSVSDYKHAKRFHEWPADWPDLNHPDTAHIGGDYNTHHLWIPYEAMAQLEAFRQAGGAVMINGAPRSLSYRVVLPHEDIIRARSW